MKVKLWLKRYNVRIYLFIYGPIRHATIVVFLERVLSFDNFLKINEF
jgi:hypothetical protein